MSDSQMQYVEHRTNGYFFPEQINEICLQSENQHSPFPSRGNSISLLNRHSNLKEAIIFQMSVKSQKRILASESLWDWMWTASAFPRSQPRRKKPGTNMLCLQLETSMMRPTIANIMNPFVPVWSPRFHLTQPLPDP